MVDCKRFSNEFRELTPNYTSKKSLQKRGKMSIAIDNQYKVYRKRHSPKLVTIRIYRRRRAVVALVFLMVALALSFVLPNTSAAAEQGEVANVVSQKYIVAQIGDTMWSIAQRVDPYGNITLLVDQLVIINGGTVTPGQKILIP